MSPQHVQTRRWRCVENRLKDTYTLSILGSTETGAVDVIQDMDYSSISGNELIRR